MRSDGATSVVPSITTGLPQFCDITIATRCNLHCKMCKAWHTPVGGPQLTYADCCAFIDGLAEFVTTPLEINVMGGEPLLIPWCLDFCDYIGQKGFRSIISTNATLIDEDMAKRIRDSQLNVLALSLESLSPGIHDWYRGEDRVHRKVMQAIEYLATYRRDDLSVTILTIIMEKNLPEIVALAEWVQRHPLFQNISLLALLETGLVPERKNWFRHPLYKDLWPQDKKQLDDAIDMLITLRQQGYKIWNPISQLKAFKEYYVDPDLFMRTTQYRLRDYIIDLDERGILYLSGEELGNLRQAHVRDLWYSEGAQRIRQKIALKGPGKRSCVINFVCAFPPDEEYKAPEQEIQAPRFCVLEVTHACPMRCLMCNYWQAEPTRSPITMVDIERFIGHLSDFVEPPFEINLAGGEPLMRADIFDIIACIASRGFKVSLTTGGYLLDDTMVRRIRSSGLTYMPVSLDSLNQEKHDFLRGRPGTFERVMQAVDALLRDKGCLHNLTIQTIIMKPNLSDIVDLVTWAHERDIAISFMALMRPNGVPIDSQWFTKQEYALLWPEDQREVQSVLDTLIYLKKSRYRIDNKLEQLYAFKEYYANPTVFVKDGPCSLGYGIINIGPDGNIYLCWEKGALGNIKEDDISALWSSARAEKMRHSIAACTRNCAQMVNCFFE